MIDRSLFISFYFTPFNWVKFEQQFQRSYKFWTITAATAAVPILKYWIIFFPLTKLRWSVTARVNKGVDLLNVSRQSQRLPTLRKLVKTANTCEGINCKLDYPRPFDFLVMDVRADTFRLELSPKYVLNSDPRFRQENTYQQSLI